MPFSDLSSSQLKRLIQLVKEKESIQAQLDRVNRSLTALENGKTATVIADRTSPTKVRGRRRRRANLKDGLLKKLQAAGKQGLTIQDLAKTLKANPGSVSVWFYTTGKKIKAIRKVGRGRFAYVA